MKTAILFKKLLGAMFAVALLAGAQAAAAQDAATVANGKVLFTRLCAACHGADRSDQGRAMLPGTDALRIRLDRRLHALQPLQLDGLRHLVVQRGGPLYAYAAERTDGKAADVWELGFAEPLLSPGGIIDASGEVERREAEFFGAIPSPKTKAPAFPVLR